MYQSSVIFNGENSSLTIITSPRSFLDCTRCSHIIRVLAPDLQAHSCVEKAGVISLVKIRELEIDETYSLRGTTLQKAIEVRSALQV